MTPARKKRGWRGVRAIARRFAADAQGAFAAEFALLVPVMILLYLGAVELLQATQLSRLVDITAETVANLVTRYTTISTSMDMPDIFAASTQVLSPYSGSNATVVVSSIAIDSKGNPGLAWSQAMNGQARTSLQGISVPAALKVAGADLILGEVTYAYTPPFDILNLGPFSMHSAIFMVPRDSTTINLAP